MGRKNTQYMDVLTHLPEWEERRPVWADPHGAYTIEILESQWDYELEGFFLAHCLGTKDAAEFNLGHRAYSVRDRFGIPHATVLCAFADVWSPYGKSADLGTIEPFWPEKTDGPELNVLQVRGRCDALAMLPFHKLVRQWYEDRGGKLQVPDSTMDTAVTRLGDSDVMYHCGYQLDLSVNHFT